MKIGICLRTWGEQGGIGVYTRNTIRNLLAMDSRNQYVLFFQDPAHIGTFKGIENAREIYVPSKSKLMWDQVASPWVARKEDVDVIFHTKMSVPLLSRRKTLMVLHGTERFIYQKFHPKSDLLFFKTIYPQFIKRATAIIAVSERGRQDIIKIMGLAPEKVTTIHLAVDSIFRVIKDKAYIEGIKEKYQLPERFLLYVGHIYPGKNVGRLFKAFERVCKEQNVKLVMAGFRRWKFEKDFDLLHQLGIEEHVQLLGHVPQEQLPALYNLASASVLPSIYESFPAPPLEANSCGCPVVASRTGGTPESAGDAALYIDPLDVEGIGEAILRVLTDEDLRRDLIEKGFQNAKRFSWEKTARKTLAVLESLALS